MKGKDYKRTISNIKLDEGLESRLERKVVTAADDKKYKTLKLIPFMVGLLIIVLGLIFGLPAINMKEKHNEGEIKIEQTDEIDTEASPDIINLISKIFTVVAYANPNEGDNKLAYENSQTAPIKDIQIDAEPIVLEPEVEILLAKYSLLMSSVPGLPFTFELHEGNKNEIFADNIKITVDNGDLLLWDNVSGVITLIGKEYIGEGKFTLYWSPLNDGDLVKDSIRMVITALKNDKIIGEQIITIKQIDEIGMYYTAVVGDIEQ